MKYCKERVGVSRWYNKVVPQLCGAPVKAKGRCAIHLAGWETVKANRRPARNPKRDAFREVSGRQKVRLRKAMTRARKGLYGAE
jgi:hypothetical protein